MYRRTYYKIILENIIKLEVLYIINQTIILYINKQRSNLLQNLIQIQNLLLTPAH